MTTPSPTFSLIVPTRQRVPSLARLLRSLAATTADLDKVEVVLVVDADDAESVAFRMDGLPLKRVVVEPGLSMGALNRAGYEASRGDFVMLLNDDVVARTRGWDRKVLACLKDFPDGILLAHTNDRLFREVLCTFPIVSRTFCELAGGICPPDYRRYRIDDHIEDVFNLLGVLGERRSVYLPDVVFEHFKYVEQDRGSRQYLPDEDVLALDAPRFLALFAERKELAVKLRQYIAGRAGRPSYPDLWRERLERVEDPFALRVPGRLRVRHTTWKWRRWLAAGWERVRTCVRHRGYRGLARAVGKRLLSPLAISRSALAPGSRLNEG